MLPAPCDNCRHIEFFNTVQEPDPSGHYLENKTVNKVVIACEDKSDGMGICSVSKNGNPLLHWMSSPAAGICWPDKSSFTLTSPDSTKDVGFGDNLGIDICGCCKFHIYVYFTDGTSCDEVIHCCSN